MSTRNNDPTMGRVYGGDTGLIHIEDGQRANAGRWMARQLDRQMRRDAVHMGQRTEEQAIGQTLCPGCYMVALFNAAVTLAQDNGQSLTELGNSMAKVFTELANGGPTRIESMSIVEDAPAPAVETTEAKQARYDWWDAAALAAARYGLGMMA